MARGNFADNAEKVILLWVDGGPPTKIKGGGFVQGDVVPSNT